MSSKQRGPLLREQILPVDIAIAMRPGFCTNRYSVKTVSQFVMSYALKDTNSWSRHCYTIRQLVLGHLLSSEPAYRETSYRAAVVPGRSPAEALTLPDPA